MLTTVDSAGSITYKALCDALSENFRLSQRLLKEGATTKTSREAKGGWVLVEPTQQDVVTSLLAITAGSQKLLLRASNTNTAVISPDEVLTVNDQFMHRSVKFRINQIQLRDAKQESQETNKKVMGEHTYVVDAALVRYMKSRRRAAHEDLVKDVAQMLPFPTTAVDIKKRIEILIEREYLSRDSKDTSVYEYQA